MNLIGTATPLTEGELDAGDKQPRIEPAATRFVRKIKNYGSTLRSGAAAKDEHSVARSHHDSPYPIINQSSSVTL